MTFTITKTTDIAPNYLIVYECPGRIPSIIRRDRKEEDMTQGLATTELLTAILLLAVLTLAGVQLGPVAIERWF
jgi:hypothetical protein